MQGSVRKKGNRWYYRFDLATINGKRQRIERSGGKTKAQALQAMRTAMAEYETTGSVLNNPDISVSDYLDYWMDNYVKINLTYNSIISYERIIRLHIKPHIGAYHLKKINPSAIQDLVNLKFKEGLAKQTLSLIRAILSKAFKMAVHPWQLIKENPVGYIEMPKYQGKKERAGHSHEAITSNMYVHLTEKTRKDTVDIFEQGLKKLSNN